MNSEGFWMGLTWGAIMGFIVGGVIGMLDPGRPSALEKAAKRIVEEQHVDRCHTQD